MFVSSALLAGAPRFPEQDRYIVLLALQMLGYAVGAMGMMPAIGGRVRILGAAASFLVLNAAAWLAFWVWISGRAGQSWHKAQYQGDV
jgi:hypothetical protein